MNWKLLVSTYAAIFIAELGDKTQLATLSLSATGSRLTVFAGAALALVTTTAIAVFAGESATRFIPPSWIRMGAGVSFLVLGVIYLLPKS